MQPPRIFYFCFSHNKPTGGNKKIYHHVDILNQSGFDAYVVHFTENFRITWFENETAVVNRSKFQERYDPSRDIFVLPEDLGNKILSFPGKKVIFNQNLFFGFKCLDKSAKSSIPYLSPDILATIVVSEHNRKILNFTYPELPVFRIYCGLDRDRFSFCDLSEKKKQIAANPNKNASEILSVYQILRSRAVRGLNHLLDWDWVWIEGKSESEVTQILKDSAIFVSLSLHEGFGLLPLEAMASGCLTLSYGLEPMTEYLPSDSQIQPGNLQKVVCHIEALADKFLKKPSELQVLTRRCRDIATAYSPQREIDSVISTWNAILDQNFDVETECPSYPKVLF